ncbi:MAG: CBASS cGAMP-activated phospholipase [Trueperaceae bacterium]|nr:CBASS cGAMP-activated phospholipase [Trueperaceae bacterium]
MSIYSLQLAQDDAQTDDMDFHVLALDGGGFKGLFSAAVLAALEEDVQTRLTDHFDLIAGTSTGGIIALALGNGMRPRELVDFFVEEGPRIFENGGRRTKTVRHCLRAKYDQGNLRRALGIALGNALLGDSDKRLVVPAFNLDNDQVYLFKTPHHPTLRRDWHVPMWQVGLATSAAPTYFPASTHVDGIRHVDGGLWANNPILVGLAEAVAFCGAPLDRIRILTVGTTTPVGHRPSSLDAGGRLRWAGHATDLIMKAQSQSATEIARHLLPTGAILRLDPVVRDNEFELDSVSTKKLIARGRLESRPLMREAADLFKHKAESYEPIYPRNGEVPA